MDRSCAIKRIKEIQRLYSFTPTIQEALDLAIEAEKHQLSGETSTISEETSTNDCISRQQVIEVLCRTRCGERAKGCPAHSCPISEEYDNLPPVTPTERTGEWVEDGYYDSPFRVCSYCGYEHPNQQEIWRFCPNCGAKMGGDTE